MKTLVRTLLFGACFLLLSTSIYAQKSGSGEVAILKTEDPDLQKSPVLNDVLGNENKIVQPIDKGGAPTRGAVLCSCSFDNRTDLYVDVYVDSNYQGTMAPWGNWSTTVYGGRTKIYAAARFNDGSIRKWGPVIEECIEATLSMKTYPEAYDWELIEGEKTEEGKKKKKK
jgi:hypothetical protein